MIMFHDIKKCLFMFVEFIVLMIIPMLFLSMETLHTFYVTEKML